jgi:hypothetical protein
VSIMPGSYEVPALHSSLPPVCVWPCLGDGLPRWGTRFAHPGTGFHGHGMRIIRCARFEVTGGADCQPPIWTLIEFEAPASSSDALASELADSLLSPGWYANWNSDTEATVVFPSKIFRYPRGDQAGREEALAHGRSVGVPERQLDWTD